MNDIGSRIKEERESRRLTQQALASLTGIARDKLAKVEGGVRRVESTELALIANALEVPVGQLLRPPARAMYRGNTSSPEARELIDWFDAYVVDSLWLRRLEASLHAARG